MHLRSPTNTHPPTPRSRGQWSWRLTARSFAQASARDRGTILLMVVGVLALLAIIGVVYATIGRSDRVTSATKVRVQRANDQVEDVAAYLASVIGDATFAVYPELTGAAGTSIARTKGFTYPAVDPTFLSVVPGSPRLPAGLTAPNAANTTYSPFNPTGSCEVPWASANNTRDSRNFGDPYIAALEPERLTRPDGTPYVTPEVDAARPFSFANRHSWRTISNFGPSGNRINLANLRSSRGGFNAEPGFGRDANNKPRMSFGVTLFDPVTGLPQPVGTAASPMIVKRYDGANANPLVVSDWCTNLLWAFRPNIPDRMDSAGNTLNPASYEYLSNFMADADGDGFVDSGWQELVDISGAYLQTPRVINKIPTRGRTRIFVAARCIDSSAMVNLNTASDIRAPYLSANALDTDFWRDNATVPGGTPADIDLRRLLAYTDILRDQGRANVAAADQGLAGIPQPAPGSPESVVADYSSPSNNANAYNAANAFVVGRSAYGGLIDVRGRGVTTPFAGSPNTDPNFLFQAVLPAPTRIEQYAIYNSRGHNGGLTPRIGTNPSTTRYSGTPYDLSDELELRAFFGLNDSDSLSRLEAALAARGPVTGANANPQYPNYSPLRDNRPRAVEMKWRDEREPDKIFRNYSSDTGSRQAILSVFSDVRHLVTTINGSRPMKGSGIAPDTTKTRRHSLDSGAITDITAALQALTNYSSYDRAPRPDDPNRFAANGSLLTPLDQPAKDDYLRYAEAVQLIFRLYLNALAPYTDDRFYPNVWWDGQSPQPPADILYRNGLVYGGNAELAVRMAAHMTANMVDAFDRERKLATSGPTQGRAAMDGNRENLGNDRNVPTSLSLDLATNINTAGVGPTYPEPGKQRDRRYVDAYRGVDVMKPLRDNLTDPTLNPFPNYRVPDSAARLSQYNQFDRSSNLKPSGSMNIFGVEPQPFLTEASSLFIYSTKPDAGGGGGGGGGGGPGGSSGGGGSGRAQPPGDSTYTVTYDFHMRASLGNDSDGDFIGEIIVFQFHNPFDQDVVLYDPAYGPADQEGVGTAATTTRRMDRFKFYVEYCGRYYAFAPQDPEAVDFDAKSGSSATRDQSKNDPVVIHAGETRVFYTTNPGSLKKFAERAAVRKPGTTTADVQRWIEGTWSNGRPTSSGQIFRQGDFLLSSTGVNDGDPQRPTQMVQVYPTTFRRVEPQHLQNSGSVTNETGDVSTTEFMDLWGNHEYTGADAQAESLKMIGDPAERRVVYLWRTMRSDSSTTAASNFIHGDLAGTTLPDRNDPSNDLLADRLRDPSTGPGLRDSALYKYREPTHPDTRFTISEEVPQGEIAAVPTTVSWGAIRRPTDKNYSATAPIGGGTLVPFAGINGGKRQLRGVLPPWCLEAKPDTDLAWTSQPARTGTDFSMNKAARHEGTAPPDGDYGTSGSKFKEYDSYDNTNGFFKSLTALFNTNSQVNDQIGRPCPKKTGNDIPRLPSLTGSGTPREYSDVAVEFYSVGEDRLGGRGYKPDGTAEELDTVATYATGTTTSKPKAIRRSRNPALFTRAGDFLLPLAIGPWYDPTRSGQAAAALQYPSNWLTNATTAEKLADREVQWMTLSEALALSCGYYGPKDATDPLFEFARLNPARQNLPKTDRGHLALDRFVPYLHTSTMRASVYQPLGSGVPFALSILDQFRAAGGASSTPRETNDASPAYTAITDNAIVSILRPTTPEAQTFATAYGTGSLTLTVPQSVSDLTLVPGTLNVNIAPWSTLNTLPLLNMSPLDAPWAFARNGQYNSKNVPFLHPNDNPEITLSGAQAYDLVQPIIDYRNKASHYEDRTASNVVAGSNRSVHNPIWDAALPNPGGGAILPVRRELGIASLGELAFINLYDTSGGTNFGAIDPRSSMFRFATYEDLLGPDPASVDGTAVKNGSRFSFHPELASAGSYDRRSDGRVDTSFDSGSNPAVYNPTAPRPLPSARMHWDNTDTIPPVQRIGTSQLVNTPQATNYQDKLAVINALTNTASIRSDIFTVYFLIHAYTPEDCDIPDDQPMVPSVAKRYVMVVDRSNVSALGVKPRILMLKEVAIP